MQTHCSKQQHARGPYLWGENLTLMDSYQAGKRQSTKPAEGNCHQLPPEGRPPTKTIPARGAAGRGHRSRDPTLGATHQQATNGTPQQAWKPFKGWHSAIQAADSHNIHSSDARTDSTVWSKHHATKHHEDKASCVSRGYKAPAGKEILCINPVASSYPTSKTEAYKPALHQHPCKTKQTKDRSPANQATRSSTQPAASGPPINPRLQ
jgi:hypothetical protein